jgi:hypothetical protein
MRGVAVEHLRGVAVQPSANAVEGVDGVLEIWIVLKGGDVAVQSLAEVPPGGETGVLMTDDEQVVAVGSQSAGSTGAGFEVFEPDGNPRPRRREVFAPTWPDEVDVGTCCSCSDGGCPQPPLNTAVANRWERVLAGEVADAD